VGASPTCGGVSRWRGAHPPAVLVALLSGLPAQRVRSSGSRCLNNTLLQEAFEIQKTGMMLKDPAWCSGDWRRAGTPCLSALTKCWARVATDGPLRGCDRTYTRLASQLRVGGHPSTGADPPPAPVQRRRPSPIVFLTFDRKPWGWSHQNKSGRGAAPWPTGAA